MKYSALFMLSCSTFLIVSKAQASASSQRTPCPEIAENSDDHRKLIDFFNKQQDLAGQIITLGGHKFMIEDSSQQRHYGMPIPSLSYLNLKGRRDERGGCKYTPVKSSTHYITLIPEENFHLFDEKGKLKPSESERVQQEALPKMGQDLKVVIENAQKAYPTLSRDQIEKLIVKAIPYSR